MTTPLDEVRIAPIIEYSIHQVQSLARRNRVTILSKSYRCQKITLRAEVAQLQETIVRLLSHAVGNTATDGSVLIGCVRTSDERLRISITDTGPGLPEEILRRARAPAAQADTPGESSGDADIGIMLGRRLAAAADGQFGVRSTANDGTTFWLEFPYGKDAGARSAPG